MVSLSEILLMTKAIEQESMLHTYTHTHTHNLRHTQSNFDEMCWFTEPLVFCTFTEMHLDLTLPWRTVVEECNQITCALNIAFLWIIWMRL